MAIDVGAAAEDRTSNQDLNDYTFISKDNPANATGTIDYISIYLYDVGVSDLDVASFEEVSTDYFTTRGNVTVEVISTGLSEFNAPGDFTAFDINAGDYIGAVASAADTDVEWDPSGYAGVWYKASDEIPCTNVEFSFLAGDTMSLYCTGTEGEAEEAANFMLGCNF